MARYVYVFGVKPDSDKVAQIEKSAGTLGTPPRKHLASGQRAQATRAARTVKSKYDTRPEEPKILFFTSPVYETDDPDSIDLGDLRPLLELCDDWVLIRVDG